MTTNNNFLCVIVWLQMSAACGNESSVWAGQEMMSDIVMGILKVVMPCWITNASSDEHINNTNTLQQAI